MAVVHVEGFAEGDDGPVVRRHPADEGHLVADLLALGDGASVVPHHRVAEALQHFGGPVALLLGVDHVGLGEDRAAAGDGGGLARTADDVAHVFDVVEQAIGLLVHERPGAGGAVAVGAVVGYAHAPGDVVGLQRDELGRLATHLEHGGDVGMERPDGAGDGFELVLVGEVQQGTDQTASRAGDAHLRDRTIRQGFEDLLQ